MFKYRLGNIDVNDDTAIVTDIYVKKNDYVKIGDVICTLETTKVAIDIEAEAEGYVEFFVEELESVKFKDLVFIIKENKDDRLSLKEPIKKELENVLITEKAQEKMKKYKIDIGDLNTGEKNIIKSRDIDDHILNKLEYSYSPNTKKNVERVVIIGAGFGAEAVADILLDYKEYEIVGFVDDNPRKDFDFYGAKIIYDNIREFPNKYSRDNYDSVIIAIASNLVIREEIFNLYKNSGIKFINAIDKSSTIARNVKMGVGNIIGGNTYIGTSTVIGNNNKIAASVNIDHHNSIGSHNLLGPNFTSPGIVKIGDLNTFGANSSLSNYVTIGNSNRILNNIAVYKNIGSRNIVK